MEIRKNILSSYATEAIQPCQTQPDAMIGSHSKMEKRKDALVFSVYHIILVGSFRPGSINGLHSFRMGTVFKQIQSVYSFICFQNTVVCFCCFWCSLLSDLRFSESAFSSLLTDPNSFEISSLTYVWTSLVKIFVIFPSFGINLGPCKSNMYKFHFFMLSMIPILLIPSKIGTVFVDTFAKNLNCPKLYDQTPCQIGKV